MRVKRISADVFCEYCQKKIAPGQSTKDQNVHKACKKAFQLHKKRAELSFYQKNKGYFFACALSALIGGTVYSTAAEVDQQCRDTGFSFEKCRVFSIVWMECGLIVTLIASVASVSRLFSERRVKS